MEEPPGGLDPRPVPAWWGSVAVHETSRGASSSAGQDLAVPFRRKLGLHHFRIRTVI
jgi:hypothetical protein